MDYVGILIGNSRADNINQYANVISCGEIEMIIQKM